jgi:hypothetical protein
MRCALAGHYGGCSAQEHRNFRNSGNSGFRLNSGSAVTNSQEHQGKPPEVSRHSASAHETSGSRTSQLHAKKNKAFFFEECMLQWAEHAAWSWPLAPIKKNKPKDDSALRLCALIIALAFVPSMRAHFNFTF